MGKARTYAEACAHALKRVEALGLGPDDCWPWPGKRNKDGYGIGWACGENRLAHRMVFQAVYGAIEHCVLHTCDNPPCCNPNHHFDGTRTHNAKDRDQKGRMPRGEASPRTIHSDTTIAALLESVAGGISVADAARALGLTYKYAWKLINGSRRRML